VEVGVKIEIIPMGLNQGNDSRAPGWTATIPSRIRTIIVSPQEIGVERGKKITHTTLKGWIF